MATKKAGSAAKKGKGKPKTEVAKGAYAVRQISTGMYLCTKGLALVASHALVPTRYGTEAEAQQVADAQKANFGQLEVVPC